MEKLAATIFIIFQEMSVQSEKNGFSSSNTPKTVVASSSNTAVVCYQYTWRHMPNDLHAQKQGYEQLKSRTLCD
jgi:hypothetical protein